MCPSKNKIRGNNLERAVVKRFEKNRYTAKRAYASNGESLGLDKEVDVLVDIGQYSSFEDSTFLHIQCKKKKKLPDWLGMSDKVDAVIFMEDRGKKYIMFDLEVFLSKVLRND